MIIKAETSRKLLPDVYDAFELFDEVTTFSVISPFRLPNKIECTYTKKEKDRLYSYFVSDPKDEHCKTVPEEGTTIEYRDFDLGHWGHLEALIHFLLRSTFSFKYLNSPFETDKTHVIHGAWDNPNQVNYTLISFEMRGEIHYLISSLPIYIANNSGKTIEVFKN